MSKISEEETFKKSECKCKLMVLNKQFFQNKTPLQRSLSVRESEHQEAQRQHGLNQFNN